jgi:outer membrane protein assembly factor BamB
MLMTRRTAVLLLLSVLPALAFAGPDWPRWRGANGGGISTEAGWNPRALEGGAKVLWKADVGAGYSDVVIQDGRLYTIGGIEDGTVFTCLDAASGRPVWQRRFDRYQEPQSTPVVDGDRVYGLFKDGTLVCLGTADGTVAWRKSLSGDLGAKAGVYGWASSPVVLGSLLVLNVNDSGVALDKRSGETVWASEPGMLEGRLAGYYATPIRGTWAGKPCVILLGLRSLMAVEPSTGEILWRCLHFGIDPVADPIVSGSEVFFSHVEFAAVLDTAGESPVEVWKNDGLLSGTSGPVLVGGYLFGSHWNRQVKSNDWSALVKSDWPLRCVEWKTGRVMWEKPFRQISLTAAGGRLILLENDGTLHVAEASPDGYRELSRADALAGERRPRRFAVPPVLCDGRLYCRNFAGEVVCIDMMK